MSRVSSALASGLPLLLGCTVAVEEEPVTKAPNVLIVMVDALRADRLGVNGYPLPTTPNIDSLAAEGINFRQAFSHATWTKPSIATLFTSLHASQHGLSQVAVVENQTLQAEVLAPRWTTLAERFRDAGYATGAVVNQVHITARFGFDQGFEFFQSRRGTAAPRLNKRLLNWLQTLPSPEEPFFAYLHYLDVHWPYNKRARDRMEELGATDLAEEPPKSGKDGVQKWGQTLDLPADLDALKARYDHEVAFADAAIGELIDSLRDLDQLDSTIVVVTADHGEGFLEHGELLHGHAPYEEMIQIPLVIRLPVELRGETRFSDFPVGLIDLMPTLLDLAGLEREPQAQGQSLVPLIHGGSIRPRLIFVESSTAIAARSAERKLIRFADGSDEYFDLLADPGEYEAIPGDCGEPCDLLESRLTAFAAAMASARSSLNTEVAPLQDQDLEDMRSLGYLD